jgi:hypothetical protein
MKKYLVIILLTWGRCAYADHQTKLFLVQFATNEHALDQTAIQKLTEVTTFLKSHPSAKIKLTGRTDFDGTIGYNMVLSRKRTNQVSDFLKTKGFIQAEIDEKWVGEVKPLATNSNSKGKSINRSVEIEITVLNYANANEWLKENQKNYEKTVKLKSAGQNRITTQNQTIIDIPADAFIDANGNNVNNQNVTIQIKEVNSTLDAIINQVYTTSGNELLESGGMIQMEAYSNANKLELASDKEISIQMPVKKNSNEMLVFEGIKDENGAIDWKSTGVTFDQSAKQEKILTQLNEALLQSLIEQVTYEKPSFGVYDFNYQLPNKLKGPHKPKKPKMPKEPEARSLFSAIGWFFSTKNMREKRVARVHKKNMDDYENRMEKYAVRLERYETYQLTYAAEIEKFEIEKQAFYDWIDEQRTKIKNEKEAWFNYHDKLRVNKNLVSLKLRSEKGTLFDAKPFNSFKHKSTCCSFLESEMNRLVYLTRMERVLNRLAGTDFKTISKDYSYNNSLKVGRLLMIDNRRTQTMLHRPYQNDFLAKFVKANEKDFITLFGKDAEEDIKYTDANLVNTKIAQSQQYFIGNTKKMGWINCDRFVRTENVKVSYPNLKGACQVIILSGLNSILNAVTNLQAEINFSRLPKNTKFKFLTLRIEGDQAYFSLVESVAVEGLKLDPEFKKVPISEVDKLLAQI